MEIEHEQVGTEIPPPANELADTRMASIEGPAQYDADNDDDDENGRT
jgi:hypothetical protein